MAWILLIIAGLFEIGWPLGFKLASMHSKYFIWFIGLSILSMGLSGYFLYLAQKSIPIGTAYVIWTGIGAIGTVLLGILFFHDSANIFRLLFLSLILIGIVGLKKTIHPPIRNTAYMQVARWRLLVMIPRIYSDYCSYP